jgi:CIC family chloride channel protein
LSDLLVVGELSGPPVFVTPEDDLFQALTKFLESGYGQIPVVDTAKGNYIWGLLTHEELIAAYNDQALRRRRDS